MILPQALLVESGGLTVSGGFGAQPPAQLGIWPLNTVSL